jgi:hypothetical protein
MCDWKGIEDDLNICYEKDDNKKEHPFKGCPNCKTDSYLMDIK